MGPSGPSNLKVSRIEPLEPEGHLPKLDGPCSAERGRTGRDSRRRPRLRDRSWNDSGMGSACEIKTHKFPCFSFCGGPKFWDGFCTRGRSRNRSRMGSVGGAELKQICASGKKISVLEVNTNSKKNVLRPPPKSARRRPPSTARTHGNT